MVLQYAGRVTAFLRSIVATRKSNENGRILTQLGFAKLRLEIKSSFFNVVFLGKVKIFQGKNYSPFVFFLGAIAVSKSGAKLSFLTLANKFYFVLVLYTFAFKLTSKLKSFCFSFDEKRKKPFQSIHQAGHHVKFLLYFRGSQHRHFNQLGSFIKVGDFLSEFANNVFLKVFSSGLAGLFFNLVPLVANKQSRLSSDSTGLFSIAEIYPVAQDKQKLKVFNQRKSVKNRYAVRTWSGMQYMHITLLRAISFAVIVRRSSSFYLRHAQCIY